MSDRILSECVYACARARACVKLCMKKYYIKGWNDIGDQTSGDDAIC